MEIKAQIIAGIKYKSHLKCNLTEVSIEDFNINSAKSSCLISHEQNRLAISKWLSPKRTRSYPYERVYNTFSASKRITLYTNLENVIIEGNLFASLPVLRLTSGIISGEIFSNSTTEEVEQF